MVEIADTACHVVCVDFVAAAADLSFLADHVAVTVAADRAAAANSPPIQGQTASGARAAGISRFILTVAPSAGDGAASGGTIRSGRNEITAFGFFMKFNKHCDKNFI